MKRFIVTTSLGAAMFAGTSAYAQSAPSAAAPPPPQDRTTSTPTDQLDDIVVVAKKRETNPHPYVICRAISSAHSRGA